MCRDRKKTLIATQLLYGRISSPSAVSQCIGHFLVFLSLLYFLSLTHQSLFSAAPLLSEHLSKHRVTVCKKNHKTLSRVSTRRVDPPLTDSRYCCSDLMSCFCRETFSCRTILSCSFSLPYVRIRITVVLMKTV